MALSILHIDDETHSAVDLRKTGVHVYAEDETTDVWGMSYAFGDDPVQDWEAEDLFCPPEIVDHVRSGGLVCAHNAAFERAVWKYIKTRRYGWPEVPVEQWRCTMAAAYAMALPGALGDLAAALGLDIQKDMKGRALMMRMAKPRGRDAGGNLIWWDDEDRKQRLRLYRRQDVETERAIHKRLLPLRPSEQSLWHLDQEINDRGVHVDEALCQAALKIVGQTTDGLNAEVREVSGGEVGACSNVQEIAAFCAKRGIETETIRKDELAAILCKVIPDDARRVLELRQEAGKASVTKIKALLAGRSRDGRARGMLQFHAASTGRWAGRRFQPQNLKRPEIVTNEALTEQAIQLVLGGHTDAVEWLFGPPLSVVGDLVRSTVRAAPGHVLYVADFSAIEGRGRDWLTGEEWKLEAYRLYDAGLGPGIYEKTAGGILGKPPEDVTKEERQPYGKVAELALGFQGGVGAFQTMAHTYGVKVTDEEAEAIKAAWREKHPRTKQFWYDIDEAAIRAVSTPGETIPCGRLAFKVAGSFLFMRLPSGRCLCYPYPRVEWVDTPWGSRKQALTFKSVLTPFNQKRRTGDPSDTPKWGRISTYGGSLTENAVQAIARDVMAEAMVRVEAEGYPVVLSVHDEVVSERPEGSGSVVDFRHLMSVVPDWAEGFPIAAEAWAGVRYRKG
ncbi:MAG: XRE family transcriptional regulator [Luteitalea sp.]|nr:XRE family transcriptional regulator [Luteitalea sp.]